MNKDKSKDLACGICLFDSETRRGGAILSYLGFKLINFHKVASNQDFLLFWGKHILLSGQPFSPLDYHGTS